LRGSNRPASRFPNGYERGQGGSAAGNYFTVWANLFQMAGLTEGESVPIHGGSSGIGTTANPARPRFRRRCFATAGSKEKCEKPAEKLAPARDQLREEDFGRGHQGSGRSMRRHHPRHGRGRLSREKPCSLAKDGCLSIIASSADRWREGQSRPDL